MQVKIWGKAQFRFIGLTPDKSELRDQDSGVWGKGWTLQKAGFASQILMDLFD